MQRRAVLFPISPSRTPFSALSLPPNNSLQSLRRPHILVPLLNQPTYEITHLFHHLSGGRRASRRVHQQD
jgi:hypothetical protein